MIQEYLLQGDTLGAFAPLIPEVYLEDIKNNEIFAVGAVDTWEYEVVGVVLCRDISGWMELVWINFSENYENSEDAMSFLRRRLEKAEKAGVLKGAFIDYKDEESAEKYAWMLRAMGFCDYQVSNDVFELTKADVREIEILHRPVSKQVKRLGALNEEKRKKIAKAIVADERAIPFPHPVDWSVYDEDISVAYMDGTDPKGLLLFSWTDDMLVFSCAWALEPKVLVLMLVAALAAFEKKADEDVRLLIPVLDAQTKGLVEKLVPGARMREMLEQRLYFGETGDVWQEL